MDKDTNEQPISTGIYIGPGAKNVTTKGNRIHGFDRGIADFGQDNRHEDNLITGKAQSTNEPPFPKKKDGGL